MPLELSYQAQPLGHLVNGDIFELVFYVHCGPYPPPALPSGSYYYRSYYRCRGSAGPGVIGCQIGFINLFKGLAFRGVIEVLLKALFVCSPGVIHVLSKLTAG